jgi:Lon protease-like protein
LALIEDAMEGNRLLGMIQPLTGDDTDKPSLSRIGCLGRITSYAETNDDRILISLTGICRFEVARECEEQKPYRQVEVDYSGFAADLLGETGARSVDRNAVIKAFRQYLEANNMSANWDEVEQIPTELLVNTLSQLAPYPAPEKQALLEAQDLPARADMLIALTELALSGGGKRARLQ